MRGIERGVLLRYAQEEGQTTRMEMTARQRARWRRGAGAPRAVRVPLGVLALVLVAGVIAALTIRQAPAARVYSVAEVRTNVNNRPAMWVGQTVLIRGAAMAVGRMNTFGTWEESVCYDPRRCLDPSVINHLYLGSDPALVTQTPPSSVLPLDFGQGRNGFVLRVSRPLAASSTDPLAFFHALPGIGHLIPLIPAKGATRQGYTHIYRVRILPPSACILVGATPSGRVCDDAEVLDVK